MRRATKKKVLVAAGAVAAIAVVAGVVLIVRSRESSPALVLPPASGSYFEIDDARVSVTPGPLYFATVNVSGALSLLANASRVEAEAKKQGLTDARVSDKRPANWPGYQNGDYYVMGHYSGAPKTFDRSQAGGRVELVEAWKEV